MHPARTAKRWTLDELHDLPDDDYYRYELIHGDLYVTPVPAPAHDSILARLRRELEPYAAANGVGLVWAPRSVIRVGESEVKPDLMIRKQPTSLTPDWTKWPLPSLVVEVVAPTTRRRDHVYKRDFYLEIGVPEYWVVDLRSRNIRVVKPGVPDDLVSETLLWSPAGAAAPLQLDVAPLFAGQVEDD